MQNIKISSQEDLDRLIDSKILGLSLDFDDSSLYNELKELWQKKFPMLIASRGASKMFLLSIYSLSRALFDQGSRVIVVGAAFRQSKIMFEFMETIWNKSPILRNIVSGGKKAGPKRDIDRRSSWVGDSKITVIPVGCLTGDTFVTTEYGIRTIGELSLIQREKKIWSANTFNDIGGYFDNGYKPVKKVTTEYGYSYAGTYNHMMRVYNSGNIIWKRTDELKIGDRILIDKTIRWFPNPIKRSAEFGKTYGKNMLRRNSEFWQDILSVDKMCMANCIRTIIRETGRIDYDNKSAVLWMNNIFSIRCLQYILLHFGIVSHATQRYTDGPCCALVIDEDSFDLLIKYIIELNEQNNGEPDYFTDRIVSIEDGFHYMTYDINVPANNEYIANGFISHNSEKNQESSCKLCYS